MVLDFRIVIMLRLKKVVTGRGQEGVFKSAGSVLFLDLEVVTQYNLFY